MEEADEPSGVLVRAVGSLGVNVQAAPGRSSIG